MTWIPELAGSNAEVIDRCNTVVLAVRVDDALKALSDPDCRWREGQFLLSACAGVRVGDLANAVPVGVQVFRFMPLSSADIGASPTALLEHGLGVLEDHGLSAAWFQAASSVLAKLHGTAPGSDDGRNAIYGAI